MKNIILYLLLFSIIFIFGCGKDETVDAESITAQVYDIEEPEIIEEDVELIEEEREDIVTVRLCHDTDNGIVRWVNGSIFGYYNNSKRFEFYDYCFDNNFLIEYYCEDENPMNRSFLCTNECQDNHCL
ncbi:MAG: hypothetical protein IH934_06470 [Nanoarchaeota archaeon]|nr:hypothetical protein [Nanoarchaeota archaeon]